MLSRVVAESNTAVLGNTRKPVTCKYSYKTLKKTLLHHPFTSFLNELWFNLGVVPMGATKLLNSSIVRCRTIHVISFSVIPSRSRRYQKTSWLTSLSPTKSQLNCEFKEVMINSVCTVHKSKYYTKSWALSHPDHCWFTNMVKLFMTRDYSSRQVKYIFHADISSRFCATLYLLIIPNVKKNRWDDATRECFSGQDMSEMIQGYKKTAIYMSLPWWCEQGMLSM